MVYKPQLEEVSRHIDYYWVLDSFDGLTINGKYMYAYPGITPDMVIVLEGTYTMTYMGKTLNSNRCLLFSFIHHKVHIDFSNLKRCIIVKFKSRGLSSLKPFLNVDAETLMKSSVAFVDDIFGKNFGLLRSHLKTLGPESQIKALDQWFASRHQKLNEGFVVEMTQEVSDDFDLKPIIKATGYSYFTLERYYKNETGLTPKGFQTLRRFKRAIRELQTTKNTDWQYYVNQFGYYDQSHFIKEIKRYTGRTPSALIHIPSFIEVRPEYF